jgi:peptide/nickel transport system substrate-binding protein
MKKIRWQFLIVLLALVAIGLLLFTQQPEVLPGIEQPEEQPSQGGKYSEALVGSPGRLNPLFDWVNGADREVNRLLFSSLIKFDSRGVPYGDLVDSWGVSQDGKIYNLLLRDAFWHDGRPVTADDVLFTLDLLVSPELPIPEEVREFWKAVDTQVLDEKLIQFQLPEPFSPFFDYLTFGILPKHIWEDVPVDQIVDSELNLSPVGSGPYQFNQFLTLDGQITGVALSSYKQFFKQEPFIESLELRYVPNSETAIAAFSGETAPEAANANERILGVGNIPLSTLSTAIKKDNLNIFTSLVPRSGIVLLNLDNPGNMALQDVNVRRALYAGINRQRIIDQILAGQGVLARGPIFPGSWAYYDGLPEVNYDPEMAISLLKEAGYTITADSGNIRTKDDVPLEFELLHPDDDLYSAIAVSLRDDWALIGVRANLKAVPEEELVSAYLEPKNFETALVEMNGMKSPDPDPYPFWHQTQVSSGQNYSGWSDRQASEYLERARTQVDMGARASLYKNFQVRFMNELPSLPLFYQVYSFGIDREVQGIRIGPLFDPADRFNSIYDWYILTGPVAQR